MSTLTAYLPLGFGVAHLAAIALILGLWGFYTPILKLIGRGSLNTQLHAVRMRWLQMHQGIEREHRVFDAILLGHISNSISYFGSGTLLVLAGLVSVPKYLYEAAAIDRVSKWRQFWTITFPYIRGLLMLALLFRTIEAFKLADLVILLTKGGNDTMTISYHLIRIANEQNKTSEGAAISYLMLFMVIVLTNLYLYIANRRSEGA